MNNSYLWEEADNAYLDKWWTYVFCVAYGELWPFNSN